MVATRGIACLAGALPFLLGVITTSEVASAQDHAGAPAPEFVDNDFLGEQAVRAMFPPADFTIDFDTVLSFSGGMLQPVTLPLNPIMGALTTGFVQAIYNFEPCGVLFPHVHPRGDESVFVISGTVDVGFVDEAGALIRNPALQPDTGFVIPQGYIHYLANPTCEPAKALAALPTADGGTFGGLNALFALPPNVLQASAPILMDRLIESVREQVAAAGAMSIDPVCAERCMLAPGPMGEDQ